MTSLKKECLLSGIAQIRGGALAQKFWPSFHQVLIPKISQYLLKSHNISMFFGNFCHEFHQYYHHHHHNYHVNHHHHHLY